MLPTVGDEESAVVAVEDSTVAGDFLIFRLKVDAIITVLIEIFSFGGSLTRDYYVAEAVLSLDNSTQPPT